MKRNFHVWCEVGENLEITSKSYLSLCYQIAKKKKLTGAKKVAYIAGYVAVNSINPFKAVKKVVKCVKAVKKVRRVAKTYKRYKKAKVVYKKAKKIAKATYRKSKKVVRKSTKKVYKGYLKTKCKVTKKGCFVEGTLVLTENGLIPIEDIKVGDYVWSENPETGEIELKEVLNTFEKQVDTIVTITVDGENIETTEAHLFYVENTGWVPASMLKKGDILSLEDGRNVPIESIETTTYNHYVNVYNFEVDDFHTYYVSDISVLTHNQTPCQKLAKTNTVWDNIKTTQKNNNGSNIPKSFELNLGNKKYWVHPNATKHMMEYLNKDTVKYSHGKKMIEQELLSSFNASVRKANKIGYKYDEIIKVGSWELIFSKPRKSGQLPTIKHAVYKP